MPNVSVAFWGVFPTLTGVWTQNEEHILCHRWEVKNSVEREKQIIKANTYLLDQQHNVDGV